MKRLIAILTFTLSVWTTLIAQDTETIYVCEGGVAIYNGRNYTAGTYTIRRSGQNDLTLIVLNATRYSFTQTDTIYKGDTYLYKGRKRTFNTVGVQQWNDSLLTIHGCDSVIHHQLTVLARPTTYATYNLHICQGDSIEVAGRWYHTNSSNAITLRGANYLGGDSIVTFRVIVHQQVEVTYSLTINEGTAKQWYFHRLSNLKAGTYRLTSANLLKTQYGCDSVEVLMLTVLPRTYGNDTIHLCQGQTAEYKGKTYDQTGNYDIQLTNHKGGDSILTLTVIVHPLYHTNASQTITYGDTVLLSDTVYANLLPGFYTFTRHRTTRYGCDSTITLDVEVRKARQTISWNDMRDTLATEHYYTLKATASSSLPITYEITDEGKAELLENQIHTLAPGYAAVTALQYGNELFEAAQPNRKQFVILRATGIEQIVNQTTNSCKILLNGQLYISNGKQLYNAHGIRVR